MIRLVFMTDPEGVIGASDPKVNARRFELLPKALAAVMSDLYQTRDAVIAGRNSLAGLGAPGFAAARKLCLTRGRAFDASPRLPELEPVDDFAAVVDEYKASERELVVIGGLAVFELFLPHADQIDVALTSQTYPGDLVLRGWDEKEFERAYETPWEGGKTIHLRLA